MRVILLSIFFAFAQLASAQVDSTDYSLASPYQAIYTHLNYLQEINYEPELAGKVFQVDRPVEEATDLAIKWKQILDGSGHYIHLDDVPKEPDYVDSTTNRQRYIIIKDYPNIFLEKRGKKWIFPDRAVKEINDLHKVVYPFGTDKLLNILPKIGTRKVLGLHLWQLIGIFILAFTSFVIHKVFTIIFERLIINFLHRTGYKDVAEKYVLPVARPLSIFVILLLLVILVPVLQLAAYASQYVLLIIKAALPLFGTIVFYRLVNILSYYLAHLALKTESTLDDQLVPLVRKTLKAFVVIVGSLFILENLNVPIIPLLTGLSIGGLAFALAAQDTIKNFFGSLMIFIDKPFQIGDWITSEDVDGTVEEVGFRSTRIRSFRNSVYYIPNGKLADRTIDNHGLRMYRRFFTTLGVTYDTPPEVIQLFVEGLRKIVDNHPSTRKDSYHIHFNDLGASSLNIMFYIFFEVPDWATELKARHEVLMEVMKLADHLGVNFAFPTQTLHMENFPGKMSLSPTYEDKEVLRGKLADYFSKK
ncbi:MAG: mechanosensitive ion channel family protein [Cyclobacteriaceae bacterium]